jgi:hypothetical protein
LFVSSLYPVVFYLKANDVYIIKCFYLSTGGSEGLFAQKTLEITDDILSTYKNQGMYFYHMIA